MDHGGISVSYWFPNTLIMYHLLSESPLRGPQNNWIQFMNSENVGSNEGARWFPLELGGVILRMRSVCGMTSPKVWARRDCTGWVTVGLQTRARHRSNVALQLKYNVSRLSRCVAILIKLWLGRSSSWRRSIHDWTGKFVVPIWMKRCRLVAWHRSWFEHWTV